jgi:hypothetical protein
MSTLLATRGRTFSNAFTLSNGWTGATFTGGVVFTIRYGDVIVDTASTTTGEISFIGGVGTVAFSAARTAAWAYKGTLTWEMVGTVSGAQPLVYTIDSGKLITLGWLTVDDLVSAGGAKVVDQMFNDSGNGLRDQKLLAEMMMAAESEAETRLLRGFTSDQISLLASRDEIIRMHAAYVALELVSERRTEFLAADGKGRYWVQYERALNHFNLVSKSKDHSRGEVLAGKNSQTGGRRYPTVQANTPAFVFADEQDGTKHGGF